MRSTFEFLVKFALTATVVSLSCLIGLAPSTSVAVEVEVAIGTPVEEDMHEFMEYVFQPTYLRLKSSMAELSAGQGELEGDHVRLADFGRVGEPAPRSHRRGRVTCGRSTRSKRDKPVPRCMLRQGERCRTDSCQLRQHAHPL